MTDGFSRRFSVLGLNRYAPAAYQSFQYVKASLAHNELFRNNLRFVQTFMELTAVRDAKPHLA